MAILFATSETTTDTSTTVDVGGRTLNVFALRAAGFAGLIEIQGQINSDSLWHRAEYWIKDPDALGLTGPFITPIGLSTGEMHYYVMGPWRRLRISKVQSGGTIEVDHFASPIDPSYLFAESSAGTASSAEVTQSDPDSLNVSAHLKVGLEDVDELNALPVRVMENPGTIRVPMLVSANWGTVTKKLVTQGPGVMVGIIMENRNAAARYGNIYDMNVVPIAGALPVPIISGLIPAGTANNPGILSIGIDTDFREGLAWAISTAQGTFTDSATVGEHSVHVWYQ